MDLRGRGKERYGADPIWDELKPDETGVARAADGTRIHYQVFGEGPAILCANGIGVRYPGFARQIAALRDRFQFVTWDYRGVGDSALASPEASLTMGTHAEDALAVLDALALREILVVGWSMGVQVGLELIRRRPAAVRGFLALFGTYGRPFHTAFPAPVGDAILQLCAAIRKKPEAAGALIGLGTLLPELAVPLLSTLRFISPRTDPAVFVNNMQNVADADHAAYFGTMIELAQHDASDVLPTVSCPTVIITAERDYLTPPRVARWMAAQMPKAECVILEGASHFGLIEFPEKVNAQLLSLAHEGAGEGKPRP